MYDMPFEFFQTNKHISKCTLVCNLKHILLRGLRFKGIFVLINSFHATEIIQTIDAILALINHLGETLRLIVSFFFIDRKLNSDVYFSS